MNNLIFPLPLLFHPNHNWEVDQFGAGLELFKWSPQDIFNIVEGPYIIIKLNHFYKNSNVPLESRFHGALVVNVSAKQENKPQNCLLSQLLEMEIHGKALISPTLFLPNLHNRYLTRYEDIKNKT
jgi:hypothetical protein